MELVAALSPAANELRILKNSEVLRDHLSAETDVVFGRYTEPVRCSSTWSAPHGNPDEGRVERLASLGTCRSGALSTPNHRYRGTAMMRCTFDHRRP